MGYSLPCNVCGRYCGNVAEGQPPCRQPQHVDTLYESGRRTGYEAGLLAGLQRAAKRLDGLDARACERINILIYEVKTTGKLPEVTE